MTSDPGLCALPHPELGWPCTEPAGHSGVVEVWWNDYGKKET